MTAGKCYATNSKDHHRLPPRPQYSFLSSSSYQYIRPNRRVSSVTLDRLYTTMFNTQCIYVLCGSEEKTEIIFLHRLILLFKAAMPWIGRFVAGFSTRRPGFNSSSVHVTFSPATHYISANNTQTRNKTSEGWVCKAGSAVWVVTEYEAEEFLDMLVSVRNNNFAMHKIGRRWQAKVWIRLIWCSGSLLVTKFLLFLCCVTFPNLSPFCSQSSVCAFFSLLP
jgi:hypothetical protein